MGLILKISSGVSKSRWGLDFLGRRPASCPNYGNLLLKQDASFLQPHYMDIDQLFA